MDYLTIREEATIEASRMQRAAWDEYMKRLEAPKRLAAGQRLTVEGRECVLQTARNYGRLKGKDPERAMAVFRRHPDMGELAWLVELPADRSRAGWEAACYVYGGPIPPAGDASVPLPESLWVGDEFEVEDLRGIVYLSADGPRVLAR